MTLPNSLRTGPDERGHFGQFGGRYVAETLMPLILDLERHYEAAKADPSFAAQFDDLLEHYVGRPSPLYFAERMTEELGGAKIYFKRDELNHTGAFTSDDLPALGRPTSAIRITSRDRSASLTVSGPASSASPSPSLLAAIDSSSARSCSSDRALSSCS